MPTSNRIISEIIKKVRSSKVVLLTSHVKADADGLGSCIAVYRWLRQEKIQSHIVSSYGVTNEYKFLPNTSEVGSTPKDLWPRYDLVMTFDCGDFNRLDTIAEPECVKNSFIINIDHHKSNTRFGSINWVDATYASTTLMVFDLLKEAKAKVDKESAIAIYTGLVTDTGHFSFSNTDERCHEYAKELIRLGVKPEIITENLDRKKKQGQLSLIAETIKQYKTSKSGAVAWVMFDEALFKKVGYVPGDTQEYINLLKSIDGCKLAILARQVENKKFKVSLRSSKGVDAAQMASIWGGGGHERASGFTITGTKQSVINDVLKVANKFVLSASDAE